MDYTTCSFEIKSQPDNDRTFVGFGAAFGNIDSHGDVIAKGTFKKTLEDSKSGVKAWPVMLLNHGGESAEDQMPVGLWLDMIETDYGLKVTGRLANTKKGRNIHELLRMKPRPAFSGLSIGFRCTDWEIHKAGSPARRTIKAADLVEVSLVTFPSNTLATITSVKTHVEPKPEMTMRELALADYEMLRRTMTKTNRSGW